MRTGGISRSGGRLRDSFTRDSDRIAGYDAKRSSHRVTRRSGRRRPAALCFRARRIAGRGRRRSGSRRPSVRKIRAIERQIANGPVAGLPLHLLPRTQEYPRSQIDQGHLPQCGQLPLFNRVQKNWVNKWQIILRRQLEESDMYSESTTTGGIQDLLAISAEYLGMGTDAVVACRDRSIEPFGNFHNSDRSFHDDSERLQTITKQ